MRIYKEKGIYCEGDVYVLETLEDWDEYEKLLMDKESDYISKYNPNFYSIKEDFKQYIGKIWQDKEQIRYKLNDVPVYVEYNVIAIEDNLPQMDWYWILQNVDDERDIKYLLTNCWDLENGIKE